MVKDRWSLPMRGRHRHSIMAGCQAMAVSTSKSNSKAVRSRSRAGFVLKASVPSSSWASST